MEIWKHVLSGGSIAVYLSMVLFDRVMEDSSEDYEGRNSPTGSLGLGASLDWAKFRAASSWIASQVVVKLTRDRFMYEKARRSVMKVFPKQEEWRITRQFGLDRVPESS